MKPIYLCVPYWMGEFNPARAAVARHTWRLVTPALAEGSPTERMGMLNATLAAEVAATRAAGNLPIVIAGDCTASIGVLAGLQQETPDLTLVWYDAHGDFNTHETTPSGFIGGMPLAMLCGRGEQTIVAGAGAKVHPESQVILTDARDLDPGEKEAVAASALIHLPDVAGLLDVPLPDKPIYIHFDSDVLRLSDMAAVNYPAQGGSDLATIEASLTRLAQTGRVAAVSVTLWNPELDEEGSAEQMVMGVIERLVEQL
ncbi:MAG: arginase family protein [Anaerolineae bacterium]|nr:arginase family protein [Anaerolineae bacterium]